MLFLTIICPSIKAQSSTGSFLVVSNNRCSARHVIRFQAKSEIRRMIGRHASMRRETHLIAGLVCLAHRIIKRSMYLKRTLHPVLSITVLSLCRSLALIEGTNVTALFRRSPVTVLRSLPCHSDHHLCDCNLFSSQQSSLLWSVKVANHCLGQVLSCSMVSFELSLAAFSY